MSEKQKLPTRVDINGNPLPDRPAKPAGKKSAPKPAGKKPVRTGKPAGKPSPKKPVKKAAPEEPPVSRYPQDWFLLFRENTTVSDLKPVFNGAEGLDVQIWPELNVAELTLPNRNYIDLEPVPDLAKEEALAAVLNEGYTCGFYVSVDPVCDEEELALIRRIAAESGGTLLED